MKYARRLTRSIGVLVLLAACKGGSSSAPPPPARRFAPDTTLSFDRPATEVAWSADGRFAIFSTRGRTLLIADATAHASRAFDDVTAYALPDPAHVAAVSFGHMSIYELATGLAARDPIPCDAELRVAPDGRVVCASRTAAAYRLYANDLPLEPIPRASDDAGDHLELHFDREHHLFAAVVNGHGTMTGARVYALDQAAPVFVPGGDTDHFQFTGGGLVYTERTGGVQRLAFVPLAPVGAPLLFRHDAQCGAAEMQEASAPVRCDETHVLVQGPRAACVWDLASGTVVSQLCYPAADADDAGASPPPAATAQPSPDGTLVAGLRDGRPAIWRASGDVEWRGPAVSAIAHVAFAPDGTLAAVDRAGTVWQLDPATEKLHIETLAGCATMPLFTVGPDGAAVAVCVEPGRIVAAGRARPLQAAAAPVDGAAANRDAIAWASGHHVHGFALPDGAETWDVASPDVPVALAPNGKTYAAFPTDHAVAIHDAPDRAIELPAPGGRVRDAAFSPDGALLAVRGVANELLIYAVESATLAARIPATADAIAWSPDGKRLAYTRADALVVWDVAAKTAAVHPFSPGMAWSPAAPITELRWSPDGARLAGVADGRVYVWEHLERGPRAFGFAGKGALELRPDFSAALLGDAADARALARCAVHGRATESLAPCEERFAP